MSRKMTRKMTRARKIAEHNAQIATLVDGDIQQYTKVSAKAQEMAVRQGRVHYVTKTHFGWQVTLDVKDASVACNPSGDRQYLK